MSLVLRVTFSTTTTFFLFFLKVATICAWNSVILFFCLAEASLGETDIVEVDISTKTQTNEGLENETGVTPNSNFFHWLFIFP